MHHFQAGKGQDGRAPTAQHHAKRAGVHHWTKPVKEAEWHPQYSVLLLQRQAIDVRAGERR